MAASSVIPMARCLTTPKTVGSSIRWQGVHVGAVLLQQHQVVAGNANCPLGANWVFRVAGAGASVEAVGHEVVAFRPRAAGGLHVDELVCSWRPTRSIGGVTPDL